MAEPSAAPPLSDVETQRAAARAAPDRPEPRFRLARALYRVGEYTEALSLLTDIDTPGAPPSWSFVRGLVHFKLEQWSEAEAAFERALAAEPEQADWAAWRARALQAGGDLDGAVGAFERAVALKPDRAAFAVMLARAYLTQERFADALAVVRAAPPAETGEDPMLPRLRATEPIIRLAEGRKHALQGVLDLRATHWRRAAKAFSKALELAPDQTGWRVLRARARLGAGELEAARAGLAEVVAGDPRPPWLALLSAVQQRLGDMKGATDSIERAVAADPDGPAWRAKLAGLRSLAGDASGAVAAWRDALRLSPGHAAWRFGFARALLKADDPETACNELKSLTAKGDPPPAWLFLLGSVEAKLGDTDGAIASWRRAIELAGSDAMPHWRSRLAGLLIARGDDDDAVMALEAAVPHPSATPAMRAQLAQLHWRLARGPDALEQIERALSEEPEPPFKWRLMAEEVRGRLASGEAAGSRATSMEYADAFYRSSTVQSAPAEQSHYFEFWQAAAAVIAASGARRLLDVGCGPGQFAEYILRAVPGVSYTGVDFSAVAIALAKARAPTATFIQADLMTDNEINDLEYDLVVAMEVLEHIDGDLELLARLRPGARFVASVPNFDSFGHVRFFRGADAVRDRYAERVRDLEVTPFNLAPNSTLFLMSGVLI